MHKISISDFSPIIEGNPNFLFFRVDFRTCSTRYIVKDGDKILLIDSGDGEDELDFTPDACVLTHCHYDHARGVKKGWKVFYGEDEDPSLPYVEIPPQGKRITTEKFPFGKYAFDVIKTPGHTHGGICLFEPKTGILFSGDTLFSSGNWGRTDLGGSDEAIQKSLQKLEGLNWKILCPGHGSLQTRDGKKF